MINPEQPAAVRVLVVDDTPDIRAVVRLVLEDGGRFVVVGEAVDGLEGIEKAEELQPDVVLLDRSMPRMTGLEALPGIRRVAPFADVILYTAEYDEAVHQAAIAAGAVGVMAKAASVMDLSARLSDALLQRWSDPEAGLSVRVGPVSSAAALDWIDNTARILHVVRRQPDLTDQPIPDDVFDTFEGYLHAWRDVAGGDETFTWVAHAAPADVERLVGAWASIDRIDDADLAAAGLSWSSPTGRAFFHVLTKAVVEAVEHDEATTALAARLHTQWAE